LDEQRRSIERQLWAHSRRRRVAMNVRFWDHPMSGVAAEVGRNRSSIEPLVLLVAIVLLIVDETPACTDHQLVADQDVRAI